MSTPTIAQWQATIGTYQDCHDIGGVQKSTEPGVRYKFPQDLEGRTFTFPLGRETAFEILLNTCEFLDHAVGHAGSPSLQVYAFSVLLDQQDSVPVFLELFKRANLPGRLYALCGLQLLMPSASPSLADELRSSHATIIANRACVIGPHSIDETLTDIKVRTLPDAFRKAYPRAREIFERSRGGSPSNNP